MLVKLGWWSFRREMWWCDVMGFEGQCVQAVGRCKAVIGERREDVIKFWGTVLDIQYIRMMKWMERRERVVKGKCHKITWNCHVRENNVYECKTRFKELHSANNDTCIFGSETCMWNKAHQFRVHAVEMSFLIGAYGMTRWKDESHENVQYTKDVKVVQIVDRWSEYKRKTEII